MESSHFLAVSSPYAPLQNYFSSIFDLAPKAQFTPQNLHKIAYKSTCMACR